MEKKEPGTTTTMETEGNTREYKKNSPVRWKLRLRPSLIAIFIRSLLQQSILLRKSTQKRRTFGSSITRERQ